MQIHPLIRFTHPWSFHVSQYCENSSLSTFSEQHLQTLQNHTLLNISKVISTKNYLQVSGHLVLTQSLMPLSFEIQNPFHEGQDLA